MRSTRAIIDLSRLESNYRLLCSLHREKRLMTILKANAYGHGLVPAARFLQSLGQSMFGVAIIEEAVALRKAGINGRILVLGPPAAGSQPLYVEHDVEMTIPSVDHLMQALEHIQKPSLAVHLKLDTGMGRIGMAHEGMDACMRILKETGHARLKGVYSHLAESENLDSTFCFHQFEILLASQARLQQDHPAETPEYHIANSAGFLRDERLHLDFARVGYALWAPMDFMPVISQPSANRKLRQVMSLRCPISFIKTASGEQTVGYSRTYTCQAGERIATLPIGYGDGYLRRLSNRGQVLLGNRRVPVVGNVSMDQTTISLGSHGGELGQEVTLLGGDKDQITVGEMARWAETISYQVMTNVNLRVPRVYMYDGKEVPPP